MTNTFSLALNESGKVGAYAWPGCYPVYFLCSDGGTLCPECVNKNLALIQSAISQGDDKQWEVVATDANWEDPSMHCDNCYKRIESAYGEDEVTE